MSDDHIALWRVPSAEGVEAFSARIARFSYGRHTHDSYALGTVYEGAMGFWHGGAQHLAAAQDVFAINPEEVHDGHVASPAGCFYRMLYVERAAIERWIVEDAPQVRRIFALRGPVLRDSGLAAGIRRLHDALERERDSALPLEQQSRLVDFLVALFSRYGQPQLSAKIEKDEKACVERARHYLAERLGEQVRLTEAAHAVGLSPCYFLRVFKRATGMPPHAYLNQLRLRRARSLLRKGTPPADVAAALGFCDQSHLARRFKSAFGVTLAQYASG